MPRLNKIEKIALAYFGLEYAKSQEPGAGWFAYTNHFNLHPDYPGSSCECLEDVVSWYISAQQRHSAEADSGAVVGGEYTSNQTNHTPG